ncbi:hypothetical protein DFQ01_101533 [Paenibacillus cellulosilyticus]|uniref:Secreted protein n=1 Tax=Paenibacillus cellulosilyticus TaxID=375489 RepID=A0A2V2Z1S5_9BACL|nr:hypothetical protein [Paenibacillus cellulosilyticus]PWW08807.1 hypothetical protein DFQ01_101533 [Paenibacillus cellulosilyticus]QKS48359.1 hypothetical protein HUB94_29300 [Paenibacillus cellulosilyticus]
MNKTNRRRMNRLVQTAAAAIVLAAALSQNSSLLSEKSVDRDPHDMQPKPVLIPQHAMRIERSAV